MAISDSAWANKPELEVAAQFPSQQVTGVAVSKTGRLFVNFPFWSDDHTVSVVEVLADGKTQPFPDDAWNWKEGPVQNRFVCVQSVYVDDEDMLWILDPAAPKMEAVVPQGPKLVKVDLKTNQVVKTFAFEESIAPAKSYLNDIRVDTATQQAYLTESGLGAIIVLDLKTGEMRRLLDDHPSTKAEKGVELVVDGVKVIDPKTNDTPQIHADGIALDPEGGWLYYHALTGRTLYRISTQVLNDPKVDRETLAKKVQNVATTSAPDGMLEAGNGSLYLTSLENNAVVHYNPRSKAVSTIVEDSRLQWPDSLAMAPDGHMFITASQIHLMPKYHGGKSQQKGPFTVYRLKLNPLPEPEKVPQSPTTPEESKAPAAASSPP